MCIRDSVLLNSSKGLYTNLLQAVSSAGLKLGNDDNSQYIFIKDDTGIGIGTTTPAYKLDVNGGSIFMDTDWPFYLGSTNAFLEGNSTGTIIRSNATAGFKWTDGGTTHMTLDTNGNLGIGTSTPQVKLDVDVGGNDGMGVSFAGGIATGEYQGIHFGYSENANTSYRKSGIVFERQDSAARGKIHILYNAQNGSNSAV